MKSVATSDDLRDKLSAAATDTEELKVKLQESENFRTSQSSELEELYDVVAGLESEMRHQ